MNNGLVTALLAVGVVNLILYYQRVQRNRRSKKGSQYENVIPKIVKSDDGVVKSVERFGEYVVRQMGLDAQTPAAKRLARVAEDYLRGDKSRSDDSLDNLFIFLTRVCPQITDDEIEELNREFVRELDACMVTYFSFHWEHTGKLIDQVINGESTSKRSWKKAVLSATRKQRYRRVIQVLRTKRMFSTMMEMMKAMGRHNAGIPQEGSVLVPADSAHRSPVLLLIGGGMGAGKSTVVKEIMQGPFWSAVAEKAVLVEADAFKETDVIYRALTSIGHGAHIAEAAELVHQSSTNAASALLVAALNEGRDVILDGTMSWEPFVLQTIAMARDVHSRAYCMGPGYQRQEDGSVIEQYWEPVEPAGAEESSSREGDAERVDEPPPTERKPYRIEFVGVTCDAHMAVMRGMRRAIITRRGVPVKGQLRSHKLFAASLEKYCELVDHVKIFSTSQMGGPGELIALKDDGKHNLLIDPKAFPAVANLKRLNPNANSVFELFDGCAEDEGIESWRAIVFAPNRKSRQELLATQLNNAHLRHDLSEWDLTTLAGNSRPLSQASGSLPSSLAKFDSSGSFTPSPQESGSLESLTKFDSASSSTLSLQEPQARTKSDSAGSSTSLKHVDSAGSSCPSPQESGSLPSVDKLPTTDTGATEEK